MTGLSSPGTPRFWKISWPPSQPEGGKLWPSNYMGHPQIFRFSYGPADKSKTYVQSEVPWHWSKSKWWHKILFWRSFVHNYKTLFIYQQFQCMFANKNYEIPFMHLWMRFVRYDWLDSICRRSCKIVPSIFFGFFLPFWQFLGLVMTNWSCTITNESSPICVKSAKVCTTFFYLST